jgi:transposase-like protein
MVLVAVKCPTCGETSVSKNGKTDKGTQKYLCNNKECSGSSFLENYTYTGCQPGIDEKIILMAANASGIRDTARVLGISTDKVMSTLKKRKNLLVKSI